MTRTLLLIFTLLFTLNVSAQTNNGGAQKKAKVVHNEDINDLVYNKKKSTATPSKQTKQTTNAHSAEPQQKKDPQKDSPTQKPTKPAQSKSAPRQSHNDAASSYTPRQRYNSTGYRIQIYTGGNTRNDKSAALKAQQKCRSAFPELATYVHFVSPHWVCRVGDFLRREDAQRYANKLRSKKVSTEVRIVSSNIIIAQ